MQNSEATSSTRPPQSTSFLKLIYNHNPFYLISAGLVLYGIRSTFQDDGQTAMDPWLMAGLLSGFIALLALTSYLIVRLGRVWDDARSIFMVILLLFFALSVSFDSLCLSAPNTAALMLSLGFCFCLLITEAILLGLEIKFPIRFRIPCYLMLACAFFFPLAITWQSTNFPDGDKRWLIGAFPVLCAIAVLSLIPAVRKGSSYVAKNGTPWEWPMFPFAAFVLLIIGLCGRSALLAMAFDPSIGSGSIFGSYFLVPILFACLVVLVEIGVKEDQRGLEMLGLGLIPALLPLALNFSQDSGQVLFYADLSSIAGSPVWLTIVAAAIFFAVSTVRKIQGAGKMLVAALVAVAFVTPTGQIAASLAEVSIWPCLILSVLQLRSAERRSQSWNWLLALIWLTPLAEPFAELLGQPELRFAIAGHWVLFATCLAGLSFQDRFASQLRVFCALALPVLAFASLLYSLTTNELAWFLVAYIVCLILIGLAAYRYSGDKLFIWTAALTLAVGLLATILKVRDLIVIETEGLAGFLLLGVLFFGIGVFVSCLKAGLRIKLLKSFNGLVTDVQERFLPSDASPNSTENMVPHHE